MPIGAVINVPSLTITFDGEFNSFSASPDGTNGLWRTTLKNGNRTLASNGEQEFYSDSSVGANPFSIAKGVLDIRAAPGINPLGLPYNSGVITTQNSFNQLYGYFEIDVKMPAGQGLWPAFWLLPASGAWPPELDAFEVLGNDPTELYFSTHSSVQATQSTAVNVADVSAGFNQYGVMWGPTTVNLYINRVEVASMPTPPDMNVPMYMLANLAVGGYWPGDPNSTTPFPADMLIKYVRAYAYPGTTGGTVYDVPPSANIGPAALAPVISAPATLSATTGIPTNLSLSVAANWPGGAFSVVISDNTGLLNTAATADVFPSGEGTDSLTLSGNLPAINHALTTLSYNGTSVGSEWVWVQATGPQGFQSQTPVVVTDAAPVITTNPPIISLPAATTVAAGATQALPGISVASAQSGGAVSVTVSDSTGLLKTAAVSGVTTQGEGSTALNLAGQLSAVNAGLATLTYQASVTPGADWLWVSAYNASDKQGIGHEVVTVVTQPAVLAPVVTTPAVMTLRRGTKQALVGISVVCGQTGGKLSVTVSDSAGRLRAVPVSGVTTKGQGTTSLTLVGSISAINASLASLTYQASASAGTDWLWVSANDSNGKQGISHEIVTSR